MSDNIASTPQRLARKRKHVETDKNAEGTNSHRPVKAMKEELGFGGFGGLAAVKGLSLEDGLTPMELETLSEVTVLHAGEDKALPQPEPATGIFGSLASVFRGSKKAPSITLNDLGDTIVTIKKLDSVDQNDQPKTPETLEVKCSSKSLVETANRAKWKALTKGYKVSIPQEDNDFAVLFILRAAQGLELSKEYEKFFEFDDMVKFAIIVHKYDASAKVRKAIMTRIFPVYMDAGHPCHESLIESAAYGPDFEKWLMLCWVFGLEDTFGEVLIRLVRTLSVNKQGKLCYGAERKNEFIIEGTFPTAVLNHIKETRAKYLDNLLTPAYDYAAHLRDPQLQICFAENKHSSNNCAALLACTFARGLAKMGLDVIKPPVEDVNMSVDELTKSLLEIDGHRLAVDTEGYVEDGEVPDLHPNCQNKTVWHFNVKRQLRGIEKIPEQFGKFLNLQKKKAE